MVLSFLKILPILAKRQAILDILRSIQGPTQVEPGCLASGVYEEYDGDQGIVYLERWDSEEAFRRHVQSPLYARVLTAMELAAELPEIHFYEVSGSRGLELIDALRTLPPAPKE